jgi:hypothetical protein
MSQGIESFGEPSERSPEGALRELLLRLAEAPNMRDRLIFDPIGLMSEAGLSKNDQELLLSCDTDAINARVWPEGKAPRVGPVLEIDILLTEYGPMPLVREAQPQTLSITLPENQGALPDTQRPAPTREFVGSSAVPRGIDGTTRGGARLDPGTSNPPTLSSPLPPWTSGGVR